MRLANKGRFGGWVARACVCSLILSLGVACSTVHASGVVITRRLPVETFTKIQVADAFDVSVTLGGADRVALHVDSNLVGRLDTGVSDGTLHLGLEPGTSVSGTPTLHADVTVKSLVGIDVSGAAHIDVAGDLSERRVALSVSGAGELEATIRADEADIQLSGASTARLAGRAARSVVDVSGASNLQSDRLQLGELTVDLSGASTATAWVTSSISAELSGASSLRYEGSPTFVRREVSGASSIAPL